MARAGSECPLRTCTSRARPTDTHPAEPQFCKFLQVAGMDRDARVCVIKDTLCAVAFGGAGRLCYAVCHKGVRRQSVWQQAARSWIEVQ